MSAVNAPSAESVVAALRAAHLTVATAESLTGGLVAAALTDVPGSSAVVRGGVVAYATDIKESVLGVSAELTGRRGAVDPDVALQMAEGVRRLLGSDIGVSCTGVAGPDAQDGHAPGLVYIAIARAGVPVVEELQLGGGRIEVREGTVRRALELLLWATSGSDSPPRYSGTPDGR